VSPARRPFFMTFHKCSIPLDGVEDREHGDCSGNDWVSSERILEQVSLLSRRYRAYKLARVVFNTLKANPTFDVRADPALIFLG
jgi:hypothetical protein